MGSLTGIYRMPYTRRSTYCVFVNNARIFNFRRVCAYCSLPGASSAGAALTLRGGGAAAAGDGGGGGSGVSTLPDALRSGLPASGMGDDISSWKAVAASGLFSADTVGGADTGPAAADGDSVTTAAAAAVAAAAAAPAADTAPVADALPWLTHVMPVRELGPATKPTAPLRPAAKLFLLTCVV